MLTVRTKTLWISGLTLVCMVAAMLASSSALVRSELTALELREVRAEIERVRAQIAHATAQLGVSTVDYSSWNDMYEWAETRDVEFARDNLSPSNLTHLSNHVVVAYRPDGAALIREAIDERTLEPVEFPESFERYVFDRGLVAAALRGEAPEGVMTVPEGTFLVAVRPILRSDGTGEPRGVLAFGRKLTRGTLEELSRIAGLPATLRPLGAETAPAPPAARIVDEATVGVELPLADVDGRCRSVLVASERRWISPLAAAGTRRLAAVVLVVGMLFSAINYLLLERAVLSRLHSLVADLRVIESSFSGRVRVRGNDELSATGNAINSTLAALEGYRSKLSESEARFRTMSDAAPVLMWLADGSGRRTHVNRAWLTFTGRTHDEVLRDGWGVDVHAEHAEATQAKVEEAVREGRAFELEYQLRRADGEYRWIHDHGVPHLAADGTLIGYVGGAIDITERRLVNEASERAKRVADEANRAKSEFLANMSHEIRTPLTAILGFADLLAEPQIRPEAVGEHVSTIRRNGEHLLLVINDILDHSKIEAGKMSLDPIDTAIRPLATDVVALFGPKAEAKGIGLRLDVGADVPGRARLDPVRYRQILFNLVSNAVKFTSRGEVVLRLRYEAGGAAAGDGGVLIAEVTDSGIGLSAEQSALLFTPFSQADSSTSRRFGGSGLGLSISRRLAMLMGGGITLESELGRGSVFRVTIPVCAIAEEGDSAALGTGSSRRGTAGMLRGRRILVAEDGPDNQRLITHHLRSAGAECVIAENGRVAVDAYAGAVAAGSPFDLILMDLQMPDTDGYTATGMLRRAGCDCSIVALTAHASDSERQQCLSRGFDDFASKPIDRDGLVAVCALWSGRRRSAA